MSVQALSWVLDFSEAGANDRLVMISLGHHADNEGGFVALARSTLARETRLSEITVKRIIDRLLATDELEECDQDTAPDWWRSIRPDRRPRLLRLPLFAATRTGVTGVPPSQRSNGGATGARRGRDGGNPRRSHQRKRDANLEERTEKEDLTPPSASADEPECLAGMPPKSRAKKDTDPVVGTAHAIAERVMNRKPRPVQPFLHVRSVAEACLRAEWPADEVEALMMDPTVVLTANGLDVARARRDSRTDNHEETTAQRSARLQREGMM